jgi:hypothetical protein
MRRTARWSGVLDRADLELERDPLLTRTPPVSSAALTLTPWSLRFSEVVPSKPRRTLP